MDNKEYERGSYEERSHQDNFKRYNDKYQYCRFCKCETEWEWDRCSECKNN